MIYKISCLPVIPGLDPIKFDADGEIIMDPKYMEYIAETGEKLRKQYLEDPVDYPCIIEASITLPYLELMQEIYMQKTMDDIILASGIFADRMWYSYLGGGIKVSIGMPPCIILDIKKTEHPLEAMVKAIMDVSEL
jgi:hypothetical protein